MHTLDVNSSNVPAFLIKLWKLVEDSTCDDLIVWGDGGASFIIKDQSKFARELLPQYFKHNNMASFVRQLNMYGFRKVMNYEKSGLRNDNNEMEFQHSFFVKEQIELLELIKRKIPNTRVIAETPVKSNAKDILTDLTSIRDKQESMDNMLLSMKRENELLWKELTNMRQKHKQQEQVIEKVIHFLVQVLRTQPVGVGIQRNISRMLHDSSGSKGSTSQITTVDLCQKNPKCIIVQDKNSGGPVIHEITDLDLEDSVCSFPSPIVTLKSPESNISIKSPAPNVDILLSADKPSSNIESETQQSDCPFDSSSLNSPISSAVPLEPLSILEPLQSRIPVVNDDTEVGESVLGIPLEYITANDIASSLNVASTHNVISIPEDDILRNVISIPEGNISNVISIPDNKNGEVVILPNSRASNVISIPDAADSSTNFSPTDKVGSTLSIPDFYDTTVDLQSESSMSHNFVDPLMSDSLHTPQIPITDEIDLPDFSVGDSKKQRNSTNKNSFFPPVNIAREHDYPATISSCSTLAKPSTVIKNTLSNHVLTVEEQLNQLQDHIATNTWDVDADKLLGLFSSDGMVSNDAFVNTIITGGISIKKEPEDILGNELIQFTPQMLEEELDELRSPFLNQLDPDLVDSDFPTELVDKNVNILKKTDGDIADQYTALPVDEFLTIDNDSSDPSNKRSKKVKTTKNKRRKLK